MIIKSTYPVLLKIYYYMPDHPSLIQEFSWAFDDLVPELVKTHKFLNHWHRSIDAIIAEILIDVAGTRSKTYRMVDTIFDIN